VPRPEPAPVPPPAPPAAVSDGCLEHRGIYCVLTQPDSNLRFTVRDRTGHRFSCRRVGDIGGRDWVHFPIADLALDFAVQGEPVTCENLPVGTQLQASGPGTTDLSICLACAPAP